MQIRKALAAPTSGDQLATLRQKILTVSPGGRSLWHAVLSLSLSLSLSPSPFPSPSHLPRLPLALASSLESKFAHEVEHRHFDDF